MYTVGVSIVYGRMGVCEIESVGAPPFQKDTGRLYYKLRSRFSTSGELVYVPVDAPVSMRPLISSREASEYLALLPQLEPRPFHSRNLADITAHYQQLLATCDLRDCLLLIKEVSCKERELTARSKKLGQVDTRYLKVAERLACEEFAAVLQTTPESMRTRLYAAMGQGAAS